MKALLEPSSHKSYFFEIVTIWLCHKQVNKTFMHHIQNTNIHTHRQPHIHTQIFYKTMDKIPNGNWSFLGAKFYEGLEYTIFWTLNQQWSGNGNGRVGGGRFLQSWLGHQGKELDKIFWLNKTFDVTKIFNILQYYILKYRCSFQF